MRSYADEIKKRVKENKENETVNGFVYLIKIKDKNKYKIGLTSNLKQRISSLSNQNPFEIKLITAIENNDIYKLESELHKKFADKNIKGEWFELSQKDVDYIKRIEDDIA